jgi:hypothetical protein
MRIDHGSGGEQSATSISDAEFELTQLVFHRENLSAQFKTIQGIGLDGVVDGSL